MINKLTLILVCSKLVHLIKVLLVTLSLLLLTDLFIAVSATAYVVISIVISFLALLFLRDEKLLHECDKAGHTEALFVTLYNLKSGLFSGKLKAKLKQTSVLRVVRLNVALESSFLLFAFVCHIIFPAGLYSRSGNIISNRTRVEAIREMTEDLKLSREIITSDELRGEVDEIIQELEHNSNIIANREGVNGVYKKVKDAMSKLDKADGSIVNALGQIASLLEDKEELLYEINLKNRREEVSFLKRSKPEGSDFVRVLNVRNVTDTPYNDNQSGRLPLKYRVYLKDFFRSK